MPKGDHYYWKQIEGREEKVLAESDYRKKILLVARTMGCGIEMQSLFDKYDNLLSRCTNKSERKSIQTMGIKEISDLLDNGYMGANGNLIVHHDDESIVLVDEYKSIRDAGWDEGK
jgi:hypothetical protein